MKTISAADANRHFSKIMREVERGETYVVTSRGKPRIRMVAVKEDGAEKARRSEVMRDLLEHLRTVKPLNVPITWTRDDVYDDDF